MRFIVALFVVLLLAACSGSKKYTKLGQQQEAAGLMSEAADNYYIAVQRDRQNVEAQIGLKKTGQIKLNSMLAEFAKAKSFGTKKDAVYSFHNAREYRDKVKNVGVTLEIAQFYTEDYDAVRTAYLLDLYDEGTTMLEEQRYHEAEQKFNEIRTLDPNFKDAKDLSDIAYLEPLYAEALTSMDAGLYRKAYYNFEKVIARKAEYKNCQALKQDALRKGTFTIALLPFQNSTPHAGLDAKVNAYTLEALTNINDPFLKIVDREHMQAILQEQKLQLSGVMDDATAVKVGELVGAQALLTGTVLSFETTAPKLRSTNRDAFQSYKEKKQNPDDGTFYYVTKYKAVKYTEYFNSQGCSVSFQYKLISLKTGEIIKSDIIGQERKDEVLYAKYEGDGTALVPAGQNGPNLNDNDRNMLKSMLSGRQELKSLGEMTNELFITVSSEMSNEIGGVVMNVVQ